MRKKLLDYALESADASNNLSDEKDNVISGIISDGPKDRAAIKNVAALESLIEEGYAIEAYFPGEGWKTCATKKGADYFQNEIVGESDLKVAIESYKEYMSALSDEIAQEALMGIFSRGFTEDLVKGVVNSAQRAKSILEQASGTGQGNIFVKNKSVITYLTQDGRVVGDVLRAVNDDARNLSTMGKGLQVIDNELTALSSARSNDDAAKVISGTKLNEVVLTISRMKLLGSKKLEVKGEDLESETKQVVDKNGKPIKMESGKKFMAKLVLANFFGGPIVSSILAIKKMIGMDKSSRQADEAKAKMNVDIGRLIEALKATTTIDIGIGQVATNIFEKYRNMGKSLKEANLDKDTKAAVENYMAMVKSLMFVVCDAAKLNSDFTIGISSKLNTANAGEENA